MHDTVGVRTAKLGFGFSDEGAVWDSWLGDGSAEAEATFFGWDGSAEGEGAFFGWDGSAEAEAAFLGTRWIGLLAYGWDEVFWLFDDGDGPVGWG
jgi:hypothetical protein